MNDGDDVSSQSILELVKCGTKMKINGYRLGKQAI